MALWGNNDNVTSAGVVTVSYDDLTVTGDGTAFDAVGSAQVGDIIRFGVRGNKVSLGTTYFGDAVISGITSATLLSIASTAGLSGQAIGGAGGTDFYISQLPISTVGDHTYSNKHDTVATYKTHASSQATDETLVGASVIAVNTANVDLSLGSAASGYGHDVLLNGGNTIRISTIGSGSTITTTFASAVGFATVFADIPGLLVGDTVQIRTHGDVLTNSIITSIGVTDASAIGIADTLGVAFAVGAAITFTGTNIVGLESPVTVGIATGDNLFFQRKSGGYDRQIYGVSNATSQLYDGDSGKYRTSGAGWVGVTTYIDRHGNLRVKSETLVAASGITTGANGIAYPTPE